MGFIIQGIVRKKHLFLWTFGAQDALSCCAWLTEPPSFPGLREQVWATTRFSQVLQLDIQTNYVESRVEDSTFQLPRDSAGLSGKLFSLRAADFSGV